MKRMTLKKWRSNKSGMVYAVMGLGLVLIVSVVLWLTILPVINSVDTSLGTSLNQTSQGVQSINALGAMWQSLPILFIVVGGIWFYRRIQERQEGLN